MMDTHFTPVLSSPRITLRPARVGDEDDFISAGHHAEIAKMYGVANAKNGAISRAKAESWLQSQIETEFAWVIEHANQVVGALRFHSHDAMDQRASFAIGLFSPEHLDKGLGTEAMSLAFEHGFGAMKLHRIALRVLHFNARAIAAYQKLGFQTEGRERQSARIADEWHDDIIMGLLASEFKPYRVT